MLPVQPTTESALCRDLSGCPGCLVLCGPVLVSDCVCCVLCGPAMCHVGARIRGEREPTQPAQLGSLGPWGPGPWAVPRVGLSKGHLWRARTGRNAEPPMLAAESALSPLVTHTLPGEGTINEFF